MQVGQVNEAPSLSAPSDVSVSENTAIGSLVTTLVASDGDPGTDGTIAYSILSASSGIITHLFFSSLLLMNGNI